ncbi:hypothetical protein [Tardiphaga sp. P9-11]|uniref:hypothetical protein n=1 Tax=Tardiphaga sp. P9-11 TaxID=2024614 RepID=UPI0011F3D755|nr:hypothetical protein [Tardiphaga sp. P9-11]KAA0070454.1 hypothetical protein CIW50_26760 [Tardiphaga sp. P9-11]
MKEILIAILGVASAIFGAKWFNPDFDHFPYFWKNSDIIISSDLVYVHFDFFADQKKDQAVETTAKGVPVFDKVTYVENVDMHRTSATYTIRLSSSGIEPEIKAIAPKVRPTLKRAPGEDKTAIEYTVEAELDLDQNKEYALTGVSPSPRMIYVFRNGFQGRNSLGGKDVKYPTDKLTLVYNFTSIRWSDYAETPTPSACLKRANENDPRPVDVEWQNGIAIVEAVKLKAGDKVRVYWTWRGQSPPVSCIDAL